MHNGEFISVPRAVHVFPPANYSIRKTIQQISIKFGTNKLQQK
jgi:hypothetical protein